MTQRSDRRKHDHFFKQLLTSHLADLIRIVEPKLLSRLRVEGATPLPTEFFSELTGGEQRAIDLLFRVPLRRGRLQCVAIHVEIEARFARAMALRMAEYYMLARLRCQMPIVPIVVNLKGGPPGVTRRSHREVVAKIEMARFHYYNFSLAPSRAEEFLARDEPLSWALAALMRSDMSAVEHRRACRLRIGEAALDDSARHLLANCVDTYLQLNREQQEEYRAMVMVDESIRRAEERIDRVLKEGVTWEDKVEARGHAKGMQQGMQQGVQQLVVRLLAQRFGPLSPAVRRRVEAITSAAELTRLAERLVTAGSLAELELGAEE